MHLDQRILFFKLKAKVAGGVDQIFSYWVVCYATCLVSWLTEKPFEFKGARELVNLLLYNSSHSNSCKRFVDITLTNLTGEDYVFRKTR